MVQSPKLGRYELDKIVESEVRKPDMGCRKTPAEKSTQNKLMEFERLVRQTAVEQIGVVIRLELIQDGPFDACVLHSSPPPAGCRRREVCQYYVEYGKANCRCALRKERDLMCPASILATRNLLVGPA